MQTSDSPDGDQASGAIEYGVFERAWTPAQQCLGLGGSGVAFATEHWHHRVDIVVEQGGQPHNEIGNLAGWNLSGLIPKARTQQSSYFR